MRAAAGAFDLVLFDFDGTVASSLHGIAACMGEALARFGYPRPSLDAVRATIGLTLDRGIRLLSGCPDGEVQALVDVYRDLHDDVAAPLIALYEGAGEVLDAARAAGIGRVLVSNKGTRGLTQLVAQLDLGHRFDLVLAADTVSRRKPDPGLFAAHVAPAFPGVAPGRVLVVGDTDIDLRFAGNIGARACWARYGYGDAAACAALAPAYAIDAVDDLRRVLAV